MTSTASYHRVLVAPAEMNVAALVLGVTAKDEADAVARVKRYMERKAVNHITRLAADGTVSIANVAYSIEQS